MIQPLPPLSATASAVRRGRHTLATILRDRPPRAFSALALALLGGLVLRLALVGLTEGNDFRAYARLAALTLHGRDVYALNLHHQLHGTLPWTYLPLLLYVFTALRWLADATGWPFVVLGKLPIVLADLAVGALLYRALRRRGRGDGIALLGLCLYLFNPFVLYNGAVYGRFDALALAFLVLALESAGTRRFAPAYALAITAKTFPLFLLPALALGAHRESRRRLAWAGLIVVALALPVILTDLPGLLRIFHYVRPNFGRLSWYDLLLRSHLLPAARVLHLARAVTWLYPLAMCTLVRGSLYRKAAVCFALFLVLNQVVYEQYLLWPLPFLIVVGLHERNRLALGLVALLTVAGLLENEFTWEPRGTLHYHLAPTPWVPLNVALALSVLVFIATHAWRRADEGQVTEPGDG